MHFYIGLATSGEHVGCMFAYCILPAGYCLLPWPTPRTTRKRRVFLEWPLGPLKELREKGVGPIAHFMLLIAYCMMPIAFCLVRTAYLLAFSYVSSPSPVRLQGLLPIAYCIYHIKLCYIILYFVM